MANEPIVELIDLKNMGVAVSVKYLPFARAVRIQVGGSTAGGHLRGRGFASPDILKCQCIIMK